jgi:hypothetical protein
VSEDVSGPIPEFPGQDPESPLDEPHTDGHGFSDSPDSGYELDPDDDATPSAEAGEQRS